MRRRTLLISTALGAVLALAAQAQTGGGAAPPAAETLIKATAAPVRVTAGGTATAVVRIAIVPGWHVNANPPSPDYMVPTEVVIDPAAGVRPGKPAYPPPVPLKVGFEESPIAVYGGTVEVQVPITADAQAARGALQLAAKVRFQACNDQICLTPASVPFVVPVEVLAAGAPPGEGSTGAAKSLATEPRSGATPLRSAAPGEFSPDGAPAKGSGFTTAPPKGGATSALDNPIARAFDRGGAFAFLTIFLIGLALNLTPCVYPMLGVTVSIFGARRAAPPLQVFGLALIYVFGMAITYSTLGVIAALTGGLFGAFLQNPLVLIGIGLLMVLLALSMFGLYELQPPAWLLTRLGGSGATSAAGVFFSGLVVGVFAAPCVGPPVVALLALVGAKGDPWFGFAVFFTLSMGLGLPYLVLGTFSNLLQRLPRSGDWMVWVKKLFGVILVGVGLFYGMLALAPKWSGWLLPIVLIAGGVYLGFLEKSAAARRGFQLLKRATGAVAIAGGIFLVLATPARGIAFAPVTPAELEAALRRGDLVMVDFTADWCLACHELERSTFTDARVRAAARRFRAFRVDLTRFDSPESEAWRKAYGIAGLPTIVFIGPGGAEVRAARVEGFLPPSAFVERLRLAAGAAGEAARD
jgi:thiol:disulfide interchange protein DsbD